MDDVPLRGRDGDPPFGMSVVLGVISDRTPQYSIRAHQDASGFWL
jgi:hypothetical protein